MPNARKQFFLILPIVAALFSLHGLAWPEAQSQPRGSGSPASKPQFTEVTREAGIAFVHSFGDREFSNLVEAVGAGVTWLDYDQDGWIDLYIGSGSYHPVVSSGERPAKAAANRLYRNNGDGTFQDVTEVAGVACADCFSMGVSSADYDNDGLPDLYVANFGKNALFRNLGNGKFLDVTSRAGVGDPGCSVAATWFDFDRDGWLDLYVGNYIEFDPEYRLYYDPDGFPGPMAYPGQPDRLYRNRGNGTFEDVSGASGIGGSGRAMSVAATDYDGDGYTDIYVTNDATENFLLRNLQGKGFRNVALTANVAFNGMADQTASMAVDFGDYDGDGRVDIFVSDNSLSSLYRNVGGRFRDVAPESGIARASAQFVGWGAFFFDFDNDADLDIFKVNGDLSRLFGQEDQLFENLGGGRYQDVSLRMGPYFREDYMGRGAAFADYDNDGDADIFIVNLNSRAVLLRNEGTPRNHSLSLRLVGTRSNRDGVGAAVTVVAGGIYQKSEKRSAGGYLSQNDPRMLFGIGPHTAAQRIEVVWPSGKIQVLKNVAAGKTITIQEPAD